MNKQVLRILERDEAEKRRPSRKTNPKEVTAQNPEPKTPSTPPMAKFSRKTRPAKGVKNPSDSDSCLP